MKAERPRWVVLDTNIWLSAALSPSGRPAQLMHAVLLRGQVVFSDMAFAELETRIWKPKFDRYISLEARKRILRDAKASAQWVAIAPEWAERSWSRDPEDDPFIRTALSAGAPWVVTGDDDLLSVGPIDGLHILTPAQALTNW
jgi:uncharacterized protein